MGACTGLAIGLAQAAVLPASAVRRAVWAGVTPLLWALGWLITSQVIVDVDAQYATFGASGALVATLLGGLVLALGRGDEMSADSLVARSEPVACC
jgi:hypothetical protein